MRQRQGRTKARAVTLAAALALAASPAAAQGAKPLTKCPEDAVVAGTVCTDKYEVSVWRVPGPTTINKGLVKKIQQGKATLAHLSARGSRSMRGDAMPARRDDLVPVVQKSYDLCAGLYAQMHRFPRLERGLLGRVILEDALQMLVALTVANRRVEKARTGASCGARR